MIINETTLRSKIRDLLLEERVYKIKELLEDIEFYRDFEEGELQKIEQRLRANWDRGYSKYSQVIKKDVINSEEPIDHILDAIDNFMPYYSKVGPQMTQQIGQGKLSSSDLRNYVEGQASDKLNKTRTSQREACRRQVPIQEGQECKDFKVIHADNDWTVIYPKTVLGSMSWAVGLADGSEEVYEVGSDGQQIGRVGWCTAAYTNNRFPMYAGNLHMYYFVKNKDYDISDNNRRLCISWVRLSNGEVQVRTRGGASVDARNISLNKEKIPSLVGSELIEKMKVDASSRKSTSLAEMASKVTLSMVKQDIENLKEDPASLREQLRVYAVNAKDNDVINFFVNYDSFLVRQSLTTRHNLPEDAVKKLAYDKSPQIRKSVASRSDLPKDLIEQLAKDSSYDIKSIIASRSDLPEVSIRQLVKDTNLNIRLIIIKRKDLPDDLVEQLSKDLNQSIRHAIASRSDLPEVLIRQLAQDENKFVRSSIASRSDLPEDLIGQLSQDENVAVRSDIASRNDLSKHLIMKLAQDKEFPTRKSIASRSDLPEDLIKQLAQDESNFVKAEIAKKENLPKSIVRQLAQDKSPSVRKEIARHQNLPKDIALLFVKDDALSVRISIASNLYLSEDIFIKLLEDTDEDVVNAVIENKSISDKLYNGFVEKSKVYWEEVFDWEELNYYDKRVTFVSAIIKNPKFNRKHIDMIGKTPDDIVEFLYAVDNYLEEVYVKFPHLRVIFHESGIELDQTLLDDLAENLNLEESSLLKSYINMLLS